MTIDYRSLISDDELAAAEWDAQRLTDLAAEAQLERATALVHVHKAVAAERQIAKAAGPPRLTSKIMSEAEWINLPDDNTIPVFGSPGNQLVRPLTKNILQAPEKSYKTTTMLRLMLGLARGETVYPTLPVPESRKVLYLHGEMSESEIKQRTVEARAGLGPDLGNFFQGRDFSIHLCKPEGWSALDRIVQEFAPEVLMLDPWQSYILGMDENSFKDVSPALGFLDKLIEKHGLTLFMQVHMGKDATKGARGHSSLAGWRDTLFTITKESELSISIKTEPRWAAPPPDFRLCFRDGTMHPDAPAAPQRNSQLVLFIRMRGGKISYAEAREFLGLEANPDNFRKVLQRAREAGEVASDGTEIWEKAA